MLVIATNCKVSRTTLI